MKYIASLLLSVMLLFSTILIQPSPASAVSCSVKAYTPYTGGSYNYAYAEMGCGGYGSYFTYRTCIEQNGVDKGCRSFRSNASWVGVSASCTLVGNWYTSRFRTHVYIYDAYGNYVWSSGSGYVYLRQCY